MLNNTNDKDTLLTLVQSEKNVKQKKRYDVVLLLLEGYVPKEISKVLHIPGKTVYNHIKAYEKGGLSALLIKKQSGQPKSSHPNKRQNCITLFLRARQSRRIWVHLQTGHPLLLAVWWKKNTM